MPKALSSFAITEVGKEMLRLRLDPRFFARMLVESRQCGRAVEYANCHMLYAASKDITIAEAHSERWHADQRN